MNIYLQYINFIIHLNFHFILSLKYLQKYSSIEILCNNTNLLIFDSSSFEISSTIYLKFFINSNSNFDNNVTFEYDYIGTDDISNTKSLRYLIFSSDKTFEIMNNENITIYYYNIEKSKEKISDGFGNNLIISFNCEGKIKIENSMIGSSFTNLSTKTIICLCVGFILLLILLIIIIVFYFKKNMEKSENKEKEKKPKKIKKLNEIETIGQNNNDNNINGISNVNLQQIKHLEWQLEIEKNLILIGLPFQALFKILKKK